MFLSRFIAMGAALALCQGAVAQTKITLGYTGANAFMAAFAAKDQGMFEKRGLDVTLQLTPVGSTIPAAVAAGSLQVGTLTAPVFLLANEGGVEMQIVAGASVQAKTNPTSGVTARQGANIKAPADFRGKRVGVPGLNGSQHVTFMKWLKDAGVEPKQVTYVEAAFPRMGDMLKGGQIDAALPVEPFLGRIVQTKVGYLVSNYAGEVVDSYLESFYAMSKDYVRANPKTAAAFYAAIREATDWVNKNPDAARKTQITYLKLPEKVAMTIKMPTLKAEVPLKDVQFWVDLCKDFGVTRGTATAQQVLWQP
jgi:NitT/TauT family transport system substrate-binding protein